MNTTDIKLSDKQKEVIRLMRDGWLLTKPSLYNRFYDTLKPALEKEGELKYIHSRIFSKLHDFKIISYVGTDKQELSTYKLTDLGKTIQL